MYDNKDADFNFFVPIQSDGLEKAAKKTGASRYDNMVVQGTASDDTEDSDKETLLPDGYIVDRFLKYGFLNYDHRSKDNPKYFIGEPTIAKVENNKFFVKGKLYKDNQTARDLYDTMIMLKKSGSDRRVGFSIEGKALSRDLQNPKIVTKALITGMALTLNPKNTNTYADIVKGHQVQDYIDYQFEEIQSLEKSEANGGKITYLVDIMDEENGIRYTVDKDLKLKVTKSMSTETAKPLIKEDLEPKVKVLTFEDENKLKKIKKAVDSGLLSSDVLVKATQNLLSMKKDEAYSKIRKAFLRGVIDFDTLEKARSQQLQAKHPNSSWKTINGAKVLVGSGGNIIAGAGGKLDGGGEKGKTTSSEKAKLEAGVRNAKKIIQSGKEVLSMIDKMSPEKQKGYAETKKATKNSVESAKKKVNENISKIKNFDVVSKKESKVTGEKKEGDSGKKTKNITENRFNKLDFGGGTNKVDFKKLPNTKYNTGVSLTNNDTKKTVSFGYDKYRKFATVTLHDGAKPERERTKEIYRGNSLDQKQVDSFIKEHIETETKKESKVTGEKKESKKPYHKDDNLNEFRDIANKTKDIDDFMSKLQSKKDVSPATSKEFFDKYNPSGNLTPKQAAKNLYDEVKSTGSKVTNADALDSLQKIGHKNPTNAMVEKEKKNLQRQEKGTPKLTDSERNYVKANKKDILNILGVDSFGDMDILGDYDKEIRDAVDKHKKSGGKKEGLQSAIKEAAKVASGKSVNERSAKEIGQARQKIENAMPKSKFEMTWEEFKPYGIAMQKQSSHSQPDNFYERHAKFEHDWAMKNKDRFK